MFAWWGRQVVRFRWAVLVAALGVVAVGATWGAGVFESLRGGGFDDPASPSSVAHARMERELGPQGYDVLALYTSGQATVDEPGLRDPVEGVLSRLAARPEVTQILSYYGSGQPAFVSTDGHATYVGIRLGEGDEDAKLAKLDEIRPLLAAGDGVQTEIGGLIGFLSDANNQIESDIIKAELLSMPILLILMLFIFRGLVAASTPLMVGVFAILGALTVTRVIAGITEVSVFAANVITMLGLGMAIDYALFVVSRFREELAGGHDPAQAVVRTIVTAGRTVFISSLTVAMALSSLLLFPMAFLKSMAYGGMAAVLVAMVAALTALPALLAVLGKRIDALRVPLPWRRSAPAGRDDSVVRDGGWARLARSVMRRPVWYLVGVTLVLGALATPFLRAEFGGFDERVLPAGTSSRTVAQRLAADFPGGNMAPVAVLVSGGTPVVAAAYAQELAALPNVTGAAVTATRGTSSLVSVAYPGPPSSQLARDVVTAVRATPAPPGTEVLVGGRPSADADQIESISSRLGLMALYVGVVTFVLLFLAFGSVVLPLKAIVMNVISIGASFGVVVWVFQDGNLAGWLGFTSTGFLEPTNLVLMLAILFGLSTDYEVFLLSRVREEWDRTGAGLSGATPVPGAGTPGATPVPGAGTANTTAVAAGLQRTGGIITAAALLLIVVIGGFATGGAATIKLLGVGTVVAVAVDAALVRTLLVPATMRLLGRWNWWAPGPLARVYRRYGLRET